MHKNKTVTTKVFNQMFEMIEMLMGHYENCMFHILVTKIETISEIVGPISDLFLPISDLGLKNTLKVRFFS